MQFWLILEHFPTDWDRAISSLLFDFESSQIEEKLFDRFMKALRERTGAKNKKKL